MAKIRQILRHVRFETARGTRQCRRNRAHRIRSGQTCLVIQDEGTPFAKSYCPTCALPILKQCAADLRGLRDAIYGGPIARPRETAKQVPLHSIAPHGHKNETDSKAA